MTASFNYRYANLTAAEARDEAMIVIRSAARSGQWDDLPERLVALRNLIRYAPIPAFVRKDEDGTGKS